MNHPSLLAAFTLCCAALVGCSGHSVNLDQPAAAGAPSTNRMGDVVILQHGSDPIIGDLAVDDTRLYWATYGGRVQGCVKTDCANTVHTYASHILQAEITLPARFVSASAGQVFWVAAEPAATFYSCPSVGCVGAPTKIFRDPNATHGFVSDGDYTYWPSNIDLYRCKGACGATPELVASGPAGLPLIAGETAYWLGYVMDSASLKNVPAIRSVPKDGSAPASLVAQLDLGSGAFALNADSLFWENSAAQIVSCPRADCSGTPTLVVDGAFAQDVGVDDGHVYWRDAAFALHACTISGCTSPVAVSDGETQAFVVDADYVYWTDSNENAPGSGAGFSGLNLHRLAKSAL